MRHLAKLCAALVLGAGCGYAIHLNPSNDVMGGAAIVFLIGLYLLWDR